MACQSLHTKHTPMHISKTLTIHLQWFSNNRLVCEKKRTSAGNALCMPTSPYLFPLEYIPAWPLRAKQTGKMWKLHICTWFKEWVGKRWRQKYWKVTKTQNAHLFHVVRVKGEPVLLPLFLLRRSLIAARIIFLSSKSFDSSSCCKKKKEKSRMQTKRS